MKTGVNVPIITYTTLLHVYMKSTKVLNPRRCIMRVYTREIRMRGNTHARKYARAEIRMRVHEKYA